MCPKLTLVQSNKFNTRLLLILSKYKWLLAFFSPSYWYFYITLFFFFLVYSASSGRFSFWNASRICSLPFCWYLLPGDAQCSETSQCKISMKVKPLCLGNKYKCFLLLTGHCFTDELGCHSGWHTVGWYVAAQPLRRCFKWMFVMRRCGFTDLNSQMTFN